MVTLIALDYNPTRGKQKAALRVTATGPQLRALHPNMSEVFCQKASALAAGLEHDEHRDSAREALRGFAQEIIIPPGTSLLQVVGNLGMMLEAAADQKVPGRRVVLPIPPRPTWWPRDAHP